MALPFYNWSRTASSNASADSTVNWAEGQAPSSVNDSGRAMMASTAAFRDDISGAIVTGGTSSAYTVTSYQVFDTLAHLNGAMIAFTPHATNAGTITLNVDGLGAKPLRSAPGLELPSGSTILGTPYVATYNNSDGAFYLQGGMSNPYSIPLGGLLPYTGNAAPNSAFVLPYGQAISRTTYATYFSLVGTGYGVGDGSTTFNVIDLRGRVAAGSDDMGGSAAGRLSGLSEGSVTGSATHTLTMAELPATPAPVSAVTSQPQVNGASAAAVGNGASTTTIQNGTGTNAVVFTTDKFGIMAPMTVGTNTANLGSGTAHSIVQPTIGVNYILRII